MNCTICLQKIDASRNVCTPCNHFFCSGCFFKWIYSSKTCPICRKTLIAEANTEEKQELTYIRQLTRIELQRFYDLKKDIQDKKNALDTLHHVYEERKGAFNQMIYSHNQYCEVQKVWRRSRRRRMGALWA